MASTAPYARMSDAGEAPKAAAAEVDSDDEAEAPQVGCGTKILNVAKRIGIQGVGFFSDAYDLFIINIVIAIIGKEIALESWEKSIVSTAALVGAVLGQLIFGALADIIGRRKGFIMTLCIIVIAAALSAISPPIPMGKTHKVLIALCVFRGVLGFGIGGEYPLSATITSEQAAQQKGSRGRMVAAVFSMQGVGYVTAALVGFILLKTVHDLEGLISMYFRIMMHETSEFKKETKRQKRSYSRAFSFYWVRLIGTAGCWFLLDVVFYANGLFSSTILSIFGVGKDEPDPRKALAEVAQWNVYLALMAMPGYWMAVWLIDLRWFGRRNLQLLGFALLIVLYSIIAAFYPGLKKAPGAFLFLYGLTFFVSNAGANTTTFILPSELFPTYARATFHGISAAAGKCDSIAFLAPDHPRIVFVLCAAIAVLGLLLTWLTVEETYGRSLDEINAEPSRKAFSLKKGIHLVAESDDRGMGLVTRPV